MLITAAGNLEHDAIVEKLEHYFADVPEGGDVPTCSPPVYSQSITSEQKRELKQVHLCLLVPSFRRDHADRFALAVLITLLGTGMSSRLFQKVREERGLVYDIDSLHRCLYVDGVQVAQDTEAVGGVSSSGELCFGAGVSAEAGFWSGLIDDIQIYDEVLTAEEVAELAH